MSVKYRYSGGGICEKKTRKGNTRESRMPLTKTSTSMRIMLKRRKSVISTRKDGQPHCFHENEYNRIIHKKSHLKALEKMRLHKIGSEEYE
uniref:Uncharacterized protein n=1 Tax=Arundo donax TaxID=35708 RepID=A0A0A9BBI8_ARUDO